MYEKSHENRVYNHLKKKDENEIQFIIQEGDDTRRREKIPIPAGENKNIGKVEGIQNLHFIFQTRIVPHRVNNNKEPKGVKICLSKEMNPDSIEIRRVNNNYIQVDLYFKEALPEAESGKITHIDPEVHHPVGVI